MTFSDGWGKRSNKNIENKEIKKENNNELEAYINSKCMIQYTNDINKILSLMSNSYAQYELCKHQLN
uniref:Uncharacterized protein n=1 Tax=Strongyloides stercoralis TaxID=6248 RepID=A0A0K0ETP3_STRER